MRTNLTLALPASARELAAENAAPVLTGMATVPRDVALAMALHILARTLHRWSAAEVERIAPWIVGAVLLSLDDVRIGETRGHA